MTKINPLVTMNTHGFVLDNVLDNVLQTNPLDGVWPILTALQKPSVMRIVSSADKLL